MSLWRLNYAAHASFVAPARARPQIWRLLFGIVLVAAIFLTLSQAVFGTLLGLMDPDTARDLIGEEAIGQTPAGMLMLLTQLGLLAVASGIVVIMLHKRRPWTLIGDPRLCGRQFLSVVVLLLILFAVVMILPPYRIGDAPMTQNLSFGTWALLLPFTVVAIFVQTSAEEILFRGYFQQQLAARFRSPLVWMVLPAALFGLAHYMPDVAGGNATKIVIWAALFGILMADLTARAGTLGPAMAVHFFNNLTAMAFASVPDTMSGLALYHLPFGMADEAEMAAWLPVDFAAMLVMWLAARLAIRA